ncbi:MAG TPA: bL35 family ribosomal protein [Planctomycetota bacterium]|jgi:large subunit ribosomal protein L35|nr:bL35 family ribosomal protein [Planctomycetota bacterium]
MPKSKTKKGMAKRMFLTKTGKVKRFRTKTGHMQVVKSAKQRRRLRKPLIMKGAYAKVVAHLIGSR